MSQNKNYDQAEGQGTSKGNSNNRNAKNKNQKRSNRDYNKNKSMKGKGKRNYSHEDRGYDNDSIQGKRVPYDSVRSNDINWWNKSPIYDDVTRVPFNRLYGRPYKLRTNQESVKDQNVDMAGIMSFTFVPSIGTAKDATSAVNRTFNSLFGELYSKTTGTPPIQYMDVANFITALSSIACLIGHVKRALGISQLYNNWNYNFPDPLLAATGINPDTVIGNQEQVRYKLNDLILNFNNFKVPDIMDIYVRQYALSHNVYCDEDDVTSAMYVFKPQGYYIYDDTPLEGPAYLRWVEFPIVLGGTHISDILDAIDLALEAWRNSSDLPLITGTLQRAFPDVATISLDYAHESDVVIPTVDRNIMWQINNMNVVPIKSGTLDIKQDPIGNFIKFTPELDGNVYVATIGVSTTDHLLNSYDGVIDKEFIMESTRFKCFTDPDDGSLMVPTEFVTSIELFYSSFDGPAGEIGQHVTGLYSYTLITDGEWSALAHALNMHAIGLLTQFRIHPYIFMYMQTEETGYEYELLTVIGDVYKFTTIDNAALKGLHLAATQSAYRLFLR